MASTVMIYIVAGDHTYLGMSTIQLYIVIVKIRIIINNYILLRVFTDGVELL